MKPKPEAIAPGRDSLPLRIFTGLFGGFLALALLKFGNPPIFEGLVTAPSDIYEFLLFSPWPIAWAYRLLAVVAIVGLFARPRRGAGPLWLVWILLGWLVWQVLAGARSIDTQLSYPTLKHFAANVACFCLGMFVLGRAKSLWPFWLPLLAGFALMLAVGWSQHFGGLEETRRYFWTYIYPETRQVSPEYLKKLSSDRIFATMFYANALAGALLLLLPLVLATIWRMRNWFTPAARGFVVVVVSVASLACLYWSGSKGGWLLMLGLGVIAVLRVSFSRRLKLALVGALVAVSLAGFIWRYSDFFKRGATSVSARFDYWRAALQTAGRSPGFGSGPGTFGLAYAAIKRPESEPSRLTHNDYLQQASDSGIPGFLLYTSFIAGTLAWIFRRHFWAWSEPVNAEQWQKFAVWLGVLGWSLQGVAEFGLYLPALAWPAFAFMGWLTSLDT
jgi:O-antigen ligase